MNRTIPTTPALTGHPSARRRSLRHAAPALVALWTLCAALLAIAAASCTADPFDGRHPDADTNPADVLTFAVSPRPAFTEATVSADGTATPATRAELTDDGTHWEQGDILWLDVRFYYDKVNSVDADTSYISALKYDVNEWRYLTVAEAETLNAGSIPRFSRLVRWPRGWKDWVDPSMFIVAYYAGSGKPDADGTITVNPKGELPATPLIAGGSEICSPDGKPVSLLFGYNCSRVRIPAGYKVELAATQYCSTIDFSLDNSFDVNIEPITEIPERSEDTNVFLSLNPGSIAKLTRDNVSCTFTFPETTNALGLFVQAGVSYTLTPYTSGTETPGGYDLTIADEAGLRAFAQAVNAGDTLPNGKPAAEARVLQTANIHLTQEWVPIGTGRDNPFRGAYNGNGNEISGLTITTAPQPDTYNDSYTGLFGRAEGAVLTGIRLREVRINISQGSGDYLYVGSIAGYIENSTLSLCTADGTVNTDGGDAEVIVGGIAGYSYGSTISRCRADVETKAATTTGFAYAGGIAGWNSMYSFILSCETRDRAVTAEGDDYAYAGGIAGYSSSYTFIAFCRTGANTVMALNGTVYNFAGGLVGHINGYLYSCYSRATAKATGTGRNQAGVIVGNNTTGGDVQHCYGAGAADQGTSNLAPGIGIVYKAIPTPGDIFGVMTNYPDKVESVTYGGKTYYLFTTSYDPSATPAYGIIPQRAVWKSDGAWNIGNGTYPKLNIDEYEGK